MKIIFVCGCLEPGRDGVGDYSRRLAGELNKQGHKAALISLYDKFQKGISESEQGQEETAISCLRLGNDISTNIRFYQARMWIDKVNPEWLSLQYVPFSFHPKGMPLGLSQKLVEIGRGKLWHIMFHELWLGMEKGSSFKMIIWGGVQRGIINKLLFKLKPKVIHTQSRLHRAQLAKLGIDAELLPLFGNIPANINCNRKQDVSSKRKINMVIFGTIQSDAPIKTFAKEVAHYEKKNKVRITLTIMGHCHPEQKRWISIWEAEGLEVEFLGEQPFKCVSEVLQRASIGIGTTAFANIEKSGSVAAMLEHGLRVICLSRPWRSRGINDFEPSFKNIFEYQKGNLSFCLEEGLIEEGDFPSLSKISCQFNKSLMKIN